jgi:hypothetical protein
MSNKSSRKKLEKIGKNKERKRLIETMEKRG